LILIFKKENNNKRSIMSFDNTQITSASGYNTSNIIYGKPRDGSIPNSSVTFKRVQMGTRNPDGTVGELILATERLFSFGLSPNVNMTTGKTDGYTLALCLWNMDSPSKQEKEWTDTFNKICEHASEYILEHRDDVGKYELEKADLKKFNPLFIKKEKGKVVEGAGPMLYAKLLQNKKTDTITSIFYDDQGRDIEAMTLLNKQCWVKAAIKIEGIFIGSKVSLQVKLHEAEIKLKDSGVKRLLRQVQPSEPAKVEEVVEKVDSLTVDDDTGSLKSDDEEETEKKDPEPVVPPKTVRRIGKK
jgi:Protein of unknown function (DUF2738)